MNRTARSLLIVAITLFSSTLAQADRVDDFVRARLSEQHIPGAAVAVIYNGRLVRAQGYGLADVELNVPATKETVFEIGSVTKQFTASAVMMLVQEGKINLDDRISKYLPPVPQAWNEITVRQLLTHTSGIRNYTGLSGFELSKHLKQEEFIKTIAAYPLDFPPGERWSYSNTGYSLLGMIIEKASGQTYWDFMRRKIFRPLGMNSTTDRDPKTIIRNRAAGYEWVNGALEHRDTDFTDLTSAGAIVSTVLDLAKWEAALDSGTLLPKSIQDQMWIPVKLSKGDAYPYGLGWNIESLLGHRVIRHGGLTAGFSATFTRYVDDHLTIIILCNLGDASLNSRIGRGIARFYVPALSMDSITASADNDEQTTIALKNELNRILKDEPTLEMYTPEKRATLSTDAFKSTAERLAAYGPVRSFKFLKEEKEDKRRARLYRVALGQHTLYLRFALTEDGKLADFIIEEEQ
ncbi:MAG: serine hydrolase domain-containing protein [Pyrinomonadaceae bacterium]